MQDWLAARTAVSPDHPFIIEHLGHGQKNTISFRYLNQQVAQMCAKFAAVGIERGQRIGILMMNSTLGIVPFFAAIRYGLVFIPLNTRLTVEELDFQLKQTNCDWLLPYGTTDKLGNLAQLGHKIAQVDRIKIRPLDAVSYVSGDIDLAQPLMIVHTSGTSGKPKGAIITYGNVFYSAMSSAYRIGHLPDDKWLCVLPLYHVGGLSILVRAVLYGITVDLHSGFNIETVNNALIDDDITLISLVPTMLFRLLQYRTTQWSDKLRLVLLGGAAATPDLMQRCLEENIPVATTYGLSEAASQVATTLPADAIKKPGTVGKPLMFARVRVVDDTGKDVRIGDYGEIIVKGLTVMQGYDNNPEATAKTVRDGWLYTGDIGYLDEDGDLWLVQRRSDLIITGGENVYPAEVENVLRQHPTIEDAAVVGIPDPEWGQRVAATIVLKNGQSADEETIVEFLREHLAGYKIPRTMRFIPNLPLTGSGKIQRPAVRDILTDD